ncbi:MAG: NAD(P)H-hydrate dehydratase [Candidatus Aminicenantes bacterium]|nr:NAD(P)H-hydrate dehydratase [Candidatus Aminicenantes bacterium]
MKISRVEEMRAMDKTAIENFGIKDELLMENAGLAVVNHILSRLGLKGKRFLCICGSGNNGGDGLVVARKLYSLGGHVRVLLLSDPSKFQGAAAMNQKIIERLPVETASLDDAASLSEYLSETDVVVDGILGTGLVREVTGRYAEIIRLINTSGKIVVSIDIPSGINGDNGQVMGTAVKADLTVTFGLPKLGNILYPGFAHCGNLAVSHISFPPEIYNDSALKVEINHPSPLPPRPPDGHKGSFGDVLFIAGAQGYYGAPTYAAMSFLRAGGGYARLAAPRSMIPFIGASGSEIVFVPQDETESGALSGKNKDRLVELSRKADFVVLGPGLSLDEETRKLVRFLVQDIQKPLLLDGDGLTAVAEDKSFLEKRKGPLVLTPHLGEMSRLTGMDVTAIKASPVDILQQKAGEWGVFFVLKGAHSLIGCPDSRVYVNMSGNSGMATAGSGDLLTGAIAAMFALGLPLEEAVRTGVFMHGFAGDLAAEKRGEDGMTARDILDFLPQAVKSYREGYESIISACYHSLTTL